MEIPGSGNPTAQAQESFERPVRPVALGRRNLFVGVTKADVFPLIRFDCPGNSLFGINEIPGWKLHGSLNIGTKLLPSMLVVFGDFGSGQFEPGGNEVGVL